MNRYYSQKLSGERLRLCYTIAPPRIQQYLNAEIDFLGQRLKSSDTVLELGCGYGRVIERILPKVEKVIGIDTSVDSLQLAQSELGIKGSCEFLLMDASNLGFQDGRFDIVFCIQNGISAFNVDQLKLIDEAIRVIRSGGSVLFSTYSEDFWEDRLEWFRIQSKHGLVGEIDESATGNGVIVCKDGFRAGMVTPDDFVSLVSEYTIKPKIFFVDKSSVFFEIERE
jgi:ubiquinone/menaquinone biosynthesis C-methylase UbiE